MGACGAGEASTPYREGRELAGGVLELGGAVARGGRRD